MSISARSPVDEAREKRRGFQFIVAAAFFFTLMSVLVKKGGETLPAAELVLARAIVTLVLSIVWAKTTGVSLRGNNHRLLLIRAAFGFTGLLCFFSAVTRLPLADVTVIHYLNPVLTAIVAAALLRERVRPSMLVALTLGIAGVVLVARPSWLVHDVTTLDPVGVWLALGGAVASAGAYTAVRKLRTTDAPIVIVFYFALFAVPAIVPFVAPVFVWPSGVQWWILLGIGVTTQLAQVLLTRGLARVPAGPAMTTGYIQIVFAAGWGMVLFGEQPDAFTVVGAALVFIGTFVVVTRT